MSLYHCINILSDKHALSQKICSVIQVWFVKLSAFPSFCVITPWKLAKTGRTREKNRGQVITEERGYAAVKYSWGWDILRPLLSAGMRWEYMKWLTTVMFSVIRCKSRSPSPEMSSAKHLLWNSVWTLLMLSRSRSWPGYSIHKYCYIFTFFKGYTLNKKIL